MGAVFAAHSDFPFHVNQFAEDHRWDYDALRISPEVDVETALVDLIAKMSYDGWFEYDIVEYEVYGDGYYAGDGPTYNIYTEPYSICCQTTASIFIGVGNYYPYGGYPWYFTSYGYYPSYHYYRPYYARRPSYGYPNYRGRYPGRNRSTDPYRPRVGVDASRHAFGGGSIDYRGRRLADATPAVSPRRRTANPVATAAGSRRTTSSPLVTGRPRTAGPTPSGRVVPPQRRTAGQTQSRPSRRVGSRTGSEPRLKSPSLPRSKSPSGRTARSGRNPSTRAASRPSSPRSSSRASRPSARSRPQARSGSASRSRARAPARSPARSGGSRRKP